MIVRVALRRSRRRPIAASSARLVSAWTMCACPRQSHQSAAMPAARRAGRGACAARLARALRLAQARRRTRRSSTSTTTETRHGAGDLATGLRAVRAPPARCRAIAATRSRRAATASAHRDDASVAGSGVTIADARCDRAGRRRTRRATTISVRSCGIVPVARRASAAVGMPPLDIRNAARVRAAAPSSQRRRAARGGACAARSGAATKAISAASAVAQSIHVSGLSWA